MSREIDERVVRMEFDNERFEKNVQTSMSTLDRLKKALKFDNVEKDPLEHIGENSEAQFSKIEKALSGLSNRLSTFEVIRRRVIEKMTDSMLAGAKKLTSFATEGIVQGGIARAMKIENASFALEGLLGKGREFDLVMKNAQDSVDGTAYGMDVASNAASMFVSSGIQAGTQLETTMNALADVTAATNSDYESMSQIFTTIAGNGRLMGDQLLQLSSRGMNAAALLKDYFVEVRGEVGVTEADIRDMVSKGEIDFETFVVAMERKFAGHAKKANDTVKGVFANVKARLSQIGAGFVSPLIVKKGPLVQFLNGVKDFLGTIKGSENLQILQKAWVQFATAKLDGATKFLDGLFRIAKHGKFAGQLVAVGDTFRGIIRFTRRFAVSIRNVIDGIISWIKPIGQAFFDVFPPMTEERWVAFGDALVNFTEKLKLSKSSAKGVRAVFKNIFSILKMGIDVLKTGLKVLTPVAGVVLKLIGMGLQAAGFLATLVSGLLEFVTEGKNAANIAKTIQKAFGDIGQAISEKFKQAIETVKSFFGLFTKDFTASFGSLDVTNTLSEDASGFDILKANIIAFVNTVKNQLASIDWNSIKLGAQNILVSAKDIVLDFAKKIPQALLTFSNTLLETFRKIDWVKIGKFISDGVVIAISALPVVLSEVGSALIKLFESIDWESVGESIGKGITYIVDTLLQMSGTIGQAITDLIKGIRVALTDKSNWSGMKFPFVEALYDALKSAFGGVIDLGGLLLGDLKEALSGVDWDELWGKALGMTYDLEIARLLHYFANIENSIGGAIDSFKGLMEGLTEQLNPSETWIDKLRELAKVLLMVAGAIAVVAGSIFLLSKIPSDQIAIGLGGLAAAVGSLLAIAVTLGVLKSKMERFSLDAVDGLALVEFAMALYVVATAFQKLASIKWDPANATMTLVALITFFKMSENLEGTTKSLKGSYKSIKEITKFIVAFAFVAKLLGTMDGGQLLSASLALGLMAGLIAILGEMGDFMEKKGGNFDLGKLDGINKIIPSLIAMAAVIKLLSTIKDGEMQNALTGLIGMTGMFVVIMGFSNKVDTRAFNQLSDAMLEFSIGMIAGMSGIILAGHFAKDALKGLVVMAGFLGELMTVFFLLGAGGAGVMGGTGLGSVLAAFGAGLSKLNSALYAFAAAATSVGVAAAGIGGGFLMLSMGFKIIQQIGDELPTIAANIANAFAELVVTIASRAPEITHAIVTCLRETMKEMLSVIPDAVDLLMTFGIDLLRSLGENAGQLVEAGANVIVKLVEGLSSHAGELVKAGIGLMASLMEGLGQGLEDNSDKIQGAVKQFVEGAVSSTGDILSGAFQGLGASLGKVVGEFVGDATTEFLPKFGDALSDFANHATDFVSTMTGIPAEKIQAIANFGAGMKSLAQAAEMAEKYHIGEGGAFGDLATDLETFLSSMKEVDTTDMMVTKAENLGKIISAVGKGCSELTDMSGYNIANVATGIAEMGTVFTELANLTTGKDSDTKALDAIDDSLVDKFEVIKKCIQAMAEVGQNMPETNGFTDLLVGGTESLENFANDIMAIGSAISLLVKDPYFQTIDSKEVNLESKFTAISEAVTVMGQAAQEIPQQTVHLRNVLTGKGDMERFGTDMAEIVKCIAKLSQNKDLQAASSNNVQKIGNIGNAVKQMAEAAKKVKEADFQNTGRAGDSLASFIDGLNGVTKKLKNFANSCKDIKEGNIAKLQKAVTSIGRISNMAANNKSDLSGFATKITSLKNAIKALGAVAKDADTDTIKTKLEELASFNVDTSAFDSLTTAITGALDKALSAMDSYKTDFNTAGKELGEQLRKGLEQKKDGAETAGQALARSANTGAGFNLNIMYQTGVNIGAGLERGLLSKLSSVRTAGIQLANAAEAGAKSKKGADVNSPSKKFIKVGESVVEGFVKGIANNESAISKSGASIGTISLKAAQQTLEIHSPSKQFEKIGKWAVKGFEKGFGSQSKATKKKINSSLGSIIKSAMNFLSSGRSKKKVHKEIDAYKKEIDYLKSTIEKAKKTLSSSTATKQDKKLAKDIIAQATSEIAVRQGAISKLNKELKNTLVKNKNLRNVIKVMSDTLGAAARKDLEKAIKGDEKSKTLKAEISEMSSDIKRLKKFRKEAYEVLNDPFASKSKKNQARLAIGGYTTTIKDIETLLKKARKRLSKRSQELAKGIAVNQIKEVKQDFSSLRKELEKIQKGLSDILMTRTKGVIAYIKASKPPKTWIKSLTNTMHSLYASDMTNSQKYYNKKLSAEKKHNKQLLNERKKLNKKLDDKGLSASQRKSLEKELKETERQLKKSSNRIKSLRKKYNLSTIGGVLGAFGDRLYKNSEEYKTTSKNLIDYAKQLTKLRKEKAKLNKEDKNYQKDKAKINKEIRQLDKKIAKEEKKLAEGASKALKKYRNEIKKTWKEQAKLSNFSIADALFSGFNWDNQDSSENSIQQLGLFSDAITKAAAATDKAKESAESLNEVYDVMGQSVSTGIDIFTKFTKTGTAEVQALFEHAATQIEAYEEFQNGLDNMAKMGFRQELIDELAEKGIDAINYVRGFQNMSADEVAKYNKDVIDKRTSLEDQKLLRTLERQERQYQKHTENVDKILTSGIFDEATVAALTKKFEQAGYSGSKSFVDALMRMSQSDQVKLAGYYVNSIAKPAQEAAKTVSEAVSDALTTDKPKEDTKATFIDNYINAKEEKAAWNKKLADLGAMIEDDDARKILVKQFEDAGKDSAEAYVDELLNMDRSEVNNFAKTVADDYANEFKEEVDRSFKNGLENILKENANWEQYGQNRADIQAKINELVSSGNEQQANDIKLVMQSLSEFGFEEMEGIQFLADATKDSIESVYEMAAALRQRESINQENSWNSLKDGYSDAKKAGKEYNSLYKEISSMDPREIFGARYAEKVQSLIDQGFTKKEAIAKADKSANTWMKEFMTQITDMGPEQGVQYMQTIMDGMASDPEGFQQFTYDWWYNNFEMPNTIADTVTAGMAVVTEGATEVWNNAGAKAGEKFVKKFKEFFDKGSNDKKSGTTAAANSFTKSIGSALTNNKETLATTARSLGKAAKDGVKAHVNESKGNAMATNLSNGLNSGMNSNKSMLKSTCRNIGKAMDDGMINGLNSGKSGVINAAVSVAVAAYQAACAALDVNSPSGKFMEIGRYADEGFAIGISNYSKVVTGSTEDMANDAINNMRSAMTHISKVLSGEIDPNPAITPTLDLSEVRAGVRELNGMIEDERVNAAFGADSQNQNAQSGTMIFNQYNTSPKALDRLEIYRQTNNQFARAKSLIGGRA